MLTIKIENDGCPENPLEWCETAFTLALFHRRYNLGHKDHGLDHGEFDSWDDMETHLAAKYAAVVKVSMHEHGSVNLYLGTPTCRWDSGTVGFAFATAEQLREYGDANAWKESVAATLRDYTNYLNGEVYGFRIMDGDEEVDACWGYYDRAHCQEEAEAALKRISLTPTPCEVQP